MKEISVINIIDVPEGMEAEAERVREAYVRYFRQQAGFLDSTFYRETDAAEMNRTRYINIVVWDSYESYAAVVNAGFDNIDGMNNDGMKVLGKGFPEPIRVSPGRYEVIGN